MKIVTMAEWEPTLIDHHQVVNPPGCHPPHRILVMTKSELPAQYTPGFLPLDRRDHPRDDRRSRVRVLPFVVLCNRISTCFLLLFLTNVWMLAHKVQMLDVLKRGVIFYVLALVAHLRVDGGHAHTYAHFWGFQDRAESAPSAPWTVSLSRVPEKLKS